MAAGRNDNGAYLRRAADYLAHEQRTLEQGSFGTYASGDDFCPMEHAKHAGATTLDYGPVVSCCAAGAICAGNLLKLSDTRFEWVCDQLAAHLELDFSDSLWTVGQWNDKPGRTKEEVVTALRAAAAVEP
jgi:hypothetical protein